MVLTSKDENNYRLLVSPKEPSDIRPAPARDALPKRSPVEALLGYGREVVIVHAGREYKLRLTQNGKLILTA
jgi:hemin uptake protein HemP